MACKNCKCDITEFDLRKMDYKRLNHLLNELATDDVCESTQVEIKNTIDKINKEK